MIRWTPYTFVRIVIFFGGGITLGVYYPDILPLYFFQILLVALVSLYLMAFFLFKFLTKAFFNLGFVALTTIFLAGYVHTLQQTESRDPHHFITLKEPIQFYEAMITKYSEEKERSWKVEAEVLNVYTTHWQNKKGKIILYFSKEEFKVPYRYGDVLLIRGNPQLVQKPSNPGEFDYKKFLAFRNIYHQHFLKAENVNLITNDSPNKIMKYALYARSWADETLKKFVGGEREQAIASALVLGVVDGLDNELLNAYAATGAMHVLAVSGLHISIIYMILLWMLKPLYKWGSGPWILAIISLCLLWGYAFITGLSPSVLRAVTMFSFVAIARPTYQSTNIYNTLAASAFCLLIFDPYMIMSVGFQLSYLAVLGIVYLQPALYRLWEPQLWLWDEVWKITSVSIAAQIATFGLGLLYFHQFPNYFLLSNLLVIPGSFLILIVGIVVLTVSVIPLLANMLGFLLMWLIKILNIIVFTVEAFPFSLIENIHITAFQCWLLMGITIAFILLFEYKRFYYSIVSLVFVMLFSLLQWHHFNQKINVQKITVYNVRGHCAIDLMDRGNTYFLTDLVFQLDTDKIRFHIRPNRLEAGIYAVSNGENEVFVRTIPGAELIRWRKMTIVHAIDKNLVLPSGFQPDWLVIGNNSVGDISKISSQLGHTKIILDSSNSFSFATRFLKKHKHLNVQVYSVLHEGAFEFTLEKTNS
jgi:competence protein ComEC